MLQLGGVDKTNDENESSKRILFTYPMIKQTDMAEDMKAEVRE